MPYILPSGAKPQVCRSKGSRQPGGAAQLGGSGGRQRSQCKEKHQLWSKTLRVQIPPLVIHWAAVQMGLLMGKVGLTTDLTELLGELNDINGIKYSAQ